MKKIYLGLILIGAGLAPAGPIYVVTDLGSLGGDSAAAFGLSSNGVAVGAASTIFGYTHAFSSSTAGFTDLTNGTGATEGMASAVNAAGQIVGTQYSGGQAFATLWQNGAAQSIGAQGSYAMAINDSGQVAGMFTTSGGQGHAFVTSNGVTQDLGALPGGTWSSAYGLNHAGEAAGYGDAGGGTFRGFVWSPATGYVTLGTLGGANSYAMAVNDTGEAVGTAQVASGYTHAFRSNGGGLQDLGTLGGGSSYAYGVNDAGDVAGYSWVAGSPDPHAFVFTSGMMIDLNSLIDASSGWVLTEAYAINGSGQIAGSGLFNGVEHAFLLDDRSGSTVSGITDASVPEPATWTLLLLGLLPASFRFLGCGRSRS